MKLMLSGQDLSCVDVLSTPVLGTKLTVLLIIPHTHPCMSILCITQEVTVTTQAVIFIFPR